MSDILGAAGLSSLSGSSSGLAALNKQLFDLLERQKKLAQDVHRLLTDPKVSVLDVLQPPPAPPPFMASLMNRMV